MPVNSELQWETQQISYNALDSTRVNIPSEVYDVIIDHLHDDLNALLECSIVCRAWLPTTRLHLFREIRFNALALPASFSAMLYSPGSTVSPSHIKKITINLWECRDQLNKEEFLWASSITSLRLHDIRFSSELWEDSSDTDYDYASQIEALKHIFSHIKCLNLSDGYFNTPSLLLELTESFPSVHNLTLRQLYFDAIEWPGHAGPHRLPTGLHTLDVSSGIRLYDLEHIIRDSPLRSIRLGRVVGGSSCNYVANIIRSFGTNLEHISLEDFNYPNQVSLLSQSVKLRSIHIMNLQLDERVEYRWVNPLKWASTLLDQVTSTCMEELLFEIIPARFEEMEGLDWDSLASALEKKPYRTLNRIQFNVPHWKLKTYCLIAERLPQWASQNIIKVI
ncbi:hypothetical protein BDZ94DRAFT_1312142 [Collybia nuda]|uniref:F-box domain-containing protein n=1 Tax=Collybia nuda TaxID=64659 RepID=A0A9P5XZS8_9AGAR|nr:hypothetical protein BDZ94DRAFT_1312142 [Collybia nuda]